ncbi:MAG TPA: DUF962 domain-containing protein [Candidatus Angelobacter sp.]|jgi:hypothetical protein|nr:DUF962 domain-containing protein [Candidatus Angelobacter sp.]
MNSSYPPAGTVPEPRFSSYDEFFTFYLREHSNPRNRLMHAAGTVLGLCTVIVPFLVGHPWYALLWPVVAYGFAWTGHFLIEGNKPATFGHPFWSFISDFRMLGLMLTGKLEARMRQSTEVLERRSA